MRDIVWTVILIWLVYKIAAMFRNKSASNFHSKMNHDSDPIYNEKKNQKDAETAHTKHLNNEGEYVDFEEIK